MNEAIYTINPAQRYSVRRLDDRSARVLIQLAKSPASLPELAARCCRSMFSVFLDLCWLYKHAFIQVARGAL